MKKLQTTACLILVSMLFNVPAFTQNVPATDTAGVISLGLYEAIEQADQNGYELLMARQEQQAAKAGFSQTRSVFLPQLSIEESAVSTNDPVAVFGIKLRQGIITQADFDPATLNDPDATHNYTTRFQVRQPVLNPSGFFQRSAAKYQYKSAEDQVRATSGYYRLKVKELYYQLGILDRQVMVLEKHLETARAFEEQAGDYFDQGMISKAEFLDAQVNALDGRKELLKVSNRRASVNDQLLLVLGIQESVRIELTDDLELAETKNLVAMPETGSNAALQAMENQVSASREMLKAAKSSFFPSLNVFGSYELHDTNVFGNQADNYIIGASLKWDLFKGFKQAGLVSQRKAELRKSEIQYRKGRHEHRLKIKESRRSAEEALVNLELAGLSIQQSEEDVRIRTDRYEEGMEKTSDLLLAETQNLKNKLSRLQALYQYHVSVANLEYLLETEF